VHLNRAPSFTLVPNAVGLVQRTDELSNQLTALSPSVCCLLALCRRSHFNIHICVTFPASYHAIGRSADSLHPANGLAQNIIIIGGGTAGLVVASRLAQDPTLQIVVLEAGQDQTEDPRVLTPVSGRVLCILPQIGILPVCLRYLQPQYIPFEPQLNGIGRP
jgi:hypothetical protein